MYNRHSENRFRKSEIKGSIYIARMGRFFLSSLIDIFPPPRQTNPDVVVAKSLPRDVIYAYIRLSKDMAGSKEREKKTQKEIGDRAEMNFFFP